MPSRGPAMQIHCPCQDARVGLAADCNNFRASPRVGSLHARKIWIIGSHWPINGMADCRTRLPREPA